VGYRVTGITITPELDGWTSWDIPDGRESTARTLLAYSAGPAITLLAGAALLLAGPFDGWLGAWRAGLATFAILWTLDLLAPIRREGLARDGWAIADLLAARREESREENGDHGAELNGVIGAVDAALLEGHPQKARDVCVRVFLAHGSTMKPLAWAALAVRLGLAGLLLNKPEFLAEEAAPFVAEAFRFSPHDPLVSAVQEAITREPSVSSAIRPTQPVAARLIALMPAVGR
jgi:hypothetical protein